MHDLIIELRSQTMGLGTFRKRFDHLAETRGGDTLRRSLGVATPGPMTWAAAYTPAPLACMECRNCFRILAGKKSDETVRS